MRSRLQVHRLQTGRKAHLFFEHSLSIYYVPDTVVGTVDTAMTKRHGLCPHGALWQTETLNN